MAENNDEYTHPEVSIYELSIHINIVDKPDSSLNSIKRAYGKTIIERGDGISNTLKRSGYTIVNYLDLIDFLNFIDFLFIDRVKSIVSRFGVKNGINIYAVNLPDYKSSWATPVKLFVETLITQKHLSEVLKGLQEELEKELSENGFEVNVTPPTPVNIPAQRTSRHRVRMLRAKILALHVLTWGGSLITVALVAIWLIATIRDEGEAKKIDVTIKSEGPLPVVIKQPVAPPSTTYDSLPAKRKVKK